MTPQRLQCPLIWVLAAWILAFSAAYGADVDLISALVIGDVVYAPYNPFTGLFMQDPLFTYSLYPLAHVGDDEKRRLDRVYYPRTYDQLTSNYDAIVFRDARVTHFGPRQFRDLTWAIKEDGMATVAAHSLSWTEAWLPTVLYDLSPISEYKFRFSSNWRVRFRTDVEPIFMPFVDLGVERSTGWEYGIMEVKQGATIWADMVPMEQAWLASWQPGGPSAGHQWAFADKFDTVWWGTSPTTRNSNPYGIDFATNLLLYSLDRDLITDVLARRNARTAIAGFQAQKLLILATLEWAEKFGANILPLSNGISEIETDSGDAVTSYLDQDYASAVACMDALSQRILELAEEATEIKDRALLWVFVSEWLAVTGVCLAAGVALWSLMIRRMMYREVRTTRMGAFRFDS